MRYWLGLFLFLVACQNDPAPVPAPIVPPVVPIVVATFPPALQDTIRKWEVRMNEGKRFCDILTSNASPEEKLRHVYYDAIRVYLEIRAHSGDPFWDHCVLAAVDVYRDQYVLPNHGKVPAYQMFPQGLDLHYRITGDNQSREAILAMAYRGAFADSYPTDWTPDQASSREMAYNLMTKLIAQRYGWQEFTLPATDPAYPNQPSLTRHVELTYKYFSDWFGCGIPPCASAEYMRPFMVGLSAKALIAWRQITHDVRVEPMLRKAADALWACCWLPGSMAFTYTDRETATGGQQPSPDLNMEVAPLYAWLCGRGHVPQCARFDAIFEGGLRGADFFSGKQFNQSWQEWFLSLAWRRGEQL